MKLEPPKGFDDYDVRLSAAQVVGQMWRAFKSDPNRNAKFRRYEMALKVYNDEVAVSGIDVTPGIDPIQLPLLSTRVDKIVEGLCSQVTNANPMFVFSGGPRDALELRESREHDTHLALVADGFKLKLRELARSASIQAIGPFRVTWRTVRRGEGWLDTQQAGSGDIVFAGPTFEPFKADEWVGYPTYARSVDEMRLFGHSFPMSIREIEGRQRSGEWLTEEQGAILSKSHSQQGSNADYVEDYAPTLGCFIVFLPIGMEEGAEWKRYRVVIQEDTDVLLYLAEYDHPDSEYFIPWLRRDTGEFYPSHSAASKMLRSQSAFNDINTARLLNGIASAKKTILASGFLDTMDTLSLGFGQLLAFRGEPRFTVIDGGGDVRGLDAMAVDAERAADGASGVSQVSAGQLPEPDQSATATSIAATGASAAIEEYQENFYAEIVRAVHFCQYLIAKNFADFKRYHGENLRTKRGSDWRPVFEIGPNSQGLANDPRAVMEKLSVLIGMAQQLGVPFVEDVMGDPYKVIMSKQELFSAALANLDFPFSMDKVVIDVPEEADGENIGVVEGGAGPEFSADPELLAEISDSLPAELLDPLSGRLEDGSLEFPAS